MRKCVQTFDWCCMLWWEEYAMCMMWWLELDCLDWPTGFASFKLPQICLQCFESWSQSVSHNSNNIINNPEVCEVHPEEDKHTTRWPERNLEGGAFMCNVITQLQAYKADNSELINSRVPGAVPLMSRCLRQGQNMEVTSPLSNRK